ncbi:MAG: hypothetical protein E6I32_10960 [Chloroflexi bacterium]|nr:MAG: hypothetical protein E6I32_10960 [Chloroflexota bacterium]
MHPFFQQQLAQQRMEELRREAVRTSYIANSKTPTRSNTRTRILSYLLLDLRVPGEKQGDFLSYRLQGRFRTTMRLVCMLSLALGLLIGSALDSKFGVFPAVVLSGMMVVVVGVPILMRSAGALKAYVVRRS